jgi:hypothetical protein
MSLTNRPQLGAIGDGELRPLVVDREQLHRHPEHLATGAGLLGDPLDLFPSRR